MWTCISNRLVAYGTTNLLVSVFWSSLQVSVTFSLVSVFLRLNWPFDFSFCRWIVPVLHEVFTQSQLFSKSNSLALFLVWSFQFKRHDIFHGRHWLAAFYWEAVGMTWFGEKFDARRVSSHYAPLVPFDERAKPLFVFVLGENNYGFRFDWFCLFDSF